MPWEQLLAGYYIFRGLQEYLEFFKEMISLKCPGGELIKNMVLHSKFIVF